MNHIYLSRNHTFVFITSAFLLLFSPSAEAQVRGAGAQPDSTGESLRRLEVGFGGSAMMTNSPPEWASDSYFQVFASLSYRLISGLYIEGGKSIANGGDISEKWMNVNDHNQAFSNKGSSKYGTWLGARYEYTLKKDTESQLRPDALYFGGGVAWEDFDIRTNSYRYYDKADGWDEESPTYQPYNDNHAFSIAELSGYYVSVASRWRLDTRKSVFSALSIGHYGIDAGLRYTVLNDQSLSHASLETPANMSFIQVFAMIYLKIGLFD